jgi:Raf kinase inhibitor-like YbhB/YbcL family protein
MLEKLPASLGRALRRARAGESELTINDPALADVPATIAVSSPAFGDGETIPERYTADGEGLSPPLAWRGVPPGAASVLLMIEDADSPTPEPLVHAIVWDLPGADGALPEGALPSGGHDGEGLRMGRNSYFSTRYLPPDPPRGHGPHRYAFQVFALRASPPFKGIPGRGAVHQALRQHAMAKGVLIGIYERR